MITRSPTSAWVSETPAPIAQSRPIRTFGPMTAVGPITVPPPISAPGPTTAAGSMEAPLSMRAEGWTNALGDTPSDANSDDGCSAAGNSARATLTKAR